MNRHSGINDSNNNKKDRTKEPIAAAIPMVGAIVTAALLLSGLSWISSYQQPVIAQTDGNATNMTAAGNVTNATAAGNVTNATAAGNVTNATAAGNVTNATTAGNATNMTAPEGGDDGGILEDIFGGGGG